MAIDSYMVFVPYGKPALDAESQVDFSSISSDKFLSDVPGLAAGKVFEVEDYSFDIEQTLNIGSQSSGAGAGKITFNPFSITRKVDKASPIFFQMACSGTSFQTVTLFLRKSSGGTTAGTGFLRFDFKLVAVKTISWAHSDEAPMETVSFEYGAMMIQYAPQTASGAMGPKVQGGWNRVRNIADLTLTAIQ